MKYLVAVKWVDGSPLTIVAYADSADEAKLYIEKKNEGYKPSGLGYDIVIPVGHVCKL